MLTTMLRRRSIDSPTTSWPSQAAPSLETDEEMRERLGVAPLATMAFATVSLPATSYDLRAATALQQRDSDAAVADLRAKKEAEWAPGGRFWLLFFVGIALRNRFLFEADFFSWSTIVWFGFVEFADQVIERKFRRRAVDDSAVGAEAI